MYFDPYYYLVILGAILCLGASARVKTTFAKYSKVRSMSGITGAEAAERILRSAGIYDVAVQRVSGDLTDHYDPRDKTLKLSDSVFDQTSVAAIGVAAHECGHAIQHNSGYVPLRLRSAIVPVANFGSAISWPIILIGALLVNSQMLINLGIVLFSLVVAFQLITLPVEFNASARAVRILGDTGILYEDELKNTKKVLGAAALTYVAGAAATILQLIRLLFLFGGRDRD
jgi:Zn-dependent membrane protease YugP